MFGTLTSLLQLLAILLVGLVAGAMFGIWRGYDLTAYSPATFIEVHQAAVRGLNALLPALAIASLVLAVVLAILARNRPAVLFAYLGAAILIAIGGAITRFANQPINDQVMAWTASSLPANWEAIRSGWWRWHLARLGVTIVAQIVLILAVFADRDTA